VAIANDLLPATFIATLGPLLEPVLHLCFDGLGQQLLSALSQDVGQDIFAPGQWHNPLFTRRKLHGGVLLGLVGLLGRNCDEFLPKYAAFFIRLSTTFGNSSIEVPLDDLCSDDNQLALLEEAIQQLVSKKRAKVSCKQAESA